MNRRILHLAIPSIVSNITVPLLGLVDTAIVGHMGDASYISAIAVGSMVFNVIYWLFGFLRMSTGGITAQSYGREDLDETERILGRSLAFSLLLGLMIILLQVPLFAFAMWVISPEDNVLSLVRSYCSICVYGAPAVLGLFSLNGWYVGMQDTRTPMVISITQNIVNIIASVILVYLLGMKIEGVAYGTLIAQWSGFFMGLAPHPPRFLSLKGAGEFLRVSRDIFFRTLFLVAVNLYFVAAGSRFGGVMLAVNTLLMQLFTFYSFVMDGFAYAAEALCGRYYGARDGASLNATIVGVFRWSVALTSIYTLLYIIGTGDFLALLTDDANVLAASVEYQPWAMLIPFAGLVAFVWDGVFIGMTMTRGMLMGTFIGASLFFGVFLLLSPSLGNHALWLAFILYLVFRGVTQTVYWFQRRINRLTV